MDFLYSEEDFQNKSEEVWKFINHLDLETIHRLIERFENKNIRRDLMEVFKERLRWASIPETVYLLEKVRKKFTLENYFLEEALTVKLSRGLK